MQALVKTCFICPSEFTRSLLQRKTNIFARKYYVNIMRCFVLWALVDVLFEVSQHRQKLKQGQRECPMRTTLHVVVWLRCNRCFVFLSSPLRDTLNIIWNTPVTETQTLNSFVQYDSERRSIDTQFLKTICCLSLFCGSSPRWLSNLASALHRQLPAGKFLFQHKCVPSPSWDFRALKFGGSHVADSHEETERTKKLKQLSSLTRSARPTPLWQFELVLETWQFVVDCWNLFSPGLISQDC